MNRSKGDFGKSDAQQCLLEGYPNQVSELNVMRNKDARSTEKTTTITTTTTKTTTTTAVAAPATQERNAKSGLE